MTHPAGTENEHRPACASFLQWSRNFVHDVVSIHRRPVKQPPVEPISCIDRVNLIC
jgi:hypothetical protein